MLSGSRGESDASQPIAVQMKVSVDDNLSQSARTKVGETANMFTGNLERCFMIG